MPDTREASQHNLMEVFNSVVAESKGKIKIEATYPRWDEQLDAATLTPRLHFFLLGNAKPQYIHSRFAQFLSGFKNCGRVLVAEEVRHDRDPDHSQ